MMFVVKVIISDKTNANVQAFQWKDKIWYMVTKPINRGIELLVHYGNEYEEDLLTNSVLIKPKVEVKAGAGMFHYVVFDSIAKSKLLLFYWFLCTLN